MENGVEWSAKIIKNLDLDGVILIWDWDKVLIHHHHHDIIRFIGFIACRQDGTEIHLRATPQVAAAASWKMEEWDEDEEKEKAEESWNAMVRSLIRTKYP